MSAIIMLDGAVKAATASYPSGLDDGEIFEYFCEEVLLKNYNLSFTDMRTLTSTEIRTEV